MYSTPQMTYTHYISEYDLISGDLLNNLNNIQIWTKITSVDITKLSTFLQRSASRSEHKIIASEVQNL